MIQIGVKYYYRIPRLYLTGGRTTALRRTEIEVPGSFFTRQGWIPSSAENGSTASERSGKAAASEIVVWKHRGY